jgi:hypothetical protein
MVSPVAVAGPDGTVALKSAEKVLSDGDAAIEKAMQDAKGIGAAVTCFLSKGIAA